MCMTLCRERGLRETGCSRTAELIPAKTLRSRAGLLLCFLGRGVMCPVIVWDVVLTHSSVGYRLPLRQAHVHTIHLLSLH